MELWQLLGDLHPKLVQFPLVLLLCGLVFDAIGLVRRDNRFHWAAAILSSAGTVILLLAFVCGIYAEIWAGRAGVPQDPIEWHELLANVASWGFVVLTAWRLFLGARNRRGLLAYTAIGLTWYSLLGLTAYAGGQLVFHYGAAVTAAQADGVPSIRDLETLATRQTDLNLKYSEMMHHVAGWMTLALAGSLLVHALFPKKARKLWWVGPTLLLVGPTLLLVGGVGLFFFADLDLYRLTDLRQFRDREVQLHKTIAIVLAVVGAAGLRRGWSVAGELGAGSRELGVGNTPPISTPHTPHSTVHIPQRTGSASKVVAIVALIGGGLLFTHVHTVAPYANVAAGVYIAHMVMGVVALSIGAARLLQDALPKWKQTLARTFAVLMVVESILLITYNEGLPWFIGHGRYNRWGPHGGTVAPFGPVRAELTFNNNSQMLDVYVFDRFKDEPAPVSAGELQLLIAQGYRETAVPLQPVEPVLSPVLIPLPPTASHFQASAPWLKDVPAFSARLALPVGGSTTMGYFDPWVTPVIQPVPPNEVARFQCPMHDGMRSATAGDCRACGMAMVPIETGPRTMPHESRYAMNVRLERQSAQMADASGATVSDHLDRMLTFAPMAEGTPLRDLPVVHEHPMHVTVVSKDLAFFDHVHPIPQPDGTLRLAYHFPQRGEYLIFAEFTPRGQRDQVFRYAMSIDDADTAPRQMIEDHAPASGNLLTRSPARGKPISGHPDLTADLICQPATPSAGLHTMLVLRLSRGGQPVTDIEPYMGAMGHCAIISEDTQTFMHCHPEQLSNPTADTRGGPAVAFHTVFPHPGRYKIWGQFQRGGRVVIADFVVDVKRPIVPAKVMNFVFNEN